MRFGILLCPSFLCRLNVEKRREVHNQAVLFWQICDLINTQGGDAAKKSGIGRPQQFIQWLAPGETAFVTCKALKELVN
jgi:hypothetical protein